MMSLSDSELTAVMTAAAPIHPRERDAFLRDVVAELAKYPEIGPGVVGRVVRRDPAPASGSAHRPQPRKQVRAMDAAA